MNGAACGGPAANSQIGGAVARQGQQRRADGAEAAARHDVDLLARLAGAVGQDFLPGAPVARAGRRGGIEPRQVAGDARAVRIVRIVRGDHVQAGRKSAAPPDVRGRDRGRRRRRPVGQHQVEAAPAAGVQSGDGRGGVAGRAVRQRQQRQFAAASLAGGRPEAARPVQHRRDHAVPVHTHPGAAAGAVAPGDHARLDPASGRPGGSQARFSISSRLAASTSGQAWPGRISRTTVHTSSWGPARRTRA